MKICLTRPFFSLTIIFMACAYPQSNSLENKTLVKLTGNEINLKQFPCTNCHSKQLKEKKEFTYTPRVPHEDLNFKHMKAIKNCYLCHNKENMDQLVLTTGIKISYQNSYQLCTQCHGMKKRDWELGIHGKQTGSWNGTKFRQACAKCHNAHAPAFPLMKADPGPVHPNLGLHDFQNKERH